MKQALWANDIHFKGKLSTTREDGKYSSGDNHKYDAEEVDRCLNCTCDPEKCNGSKNCKKYKRGSHI